MAYSVHREALSNFPFKNVIILESYMNEKCVAFPVLVNILLY